MQNRKSNGTRAEPWGRPCVKQQLELKTLKSWTRAMQSLKKDRSHRMDVGGIPVSNLWSSNFYLLTELYALLKSNRVSTECYIGRCWKPSSIACTIQVIWSSQLRPLRNLAWNRLKKFLDNTWCKTDAMVRSNFTRRFPSFQ